MSKRLLIIFGLLMAISLPGVCQAKEVTVGVSEFAPLVVQTRDGYTGFEIQLWEEVARRLGLTTTYVQKDFSDLLAATEKGEIDVALAGISVTSKREEKFDFSHPTATGSLGVVVLSESEISLSEGMKSFLQPNVLWPIIYLLLFISLCGHVVWYVERGSSSINDKYFPGIFEAFWWAFVTMTTVGYGDIAPQKWTGRIAGVFVMMSGIIFFGWFVAVLSSSLTFEQLTNDIRVEADLQSKSIGTVQGTLASDFLAKIPRTKILEFANLTEALDAVERKQVDGVVFDRLPLADKLSNSGATPLMLTEARFKPHHYGIGVKAGSALLEDINRELLALRESGVYSALHDRWIGSN